MQDLSGGTTKCLGTRVETDISILPRRLTRRQKYKKATSKDTMNPRHRTLSQRATKGPLNRPIERVAPEVRTQCSTLATKDRLATFKDH
jgi:hypothetical protein